MQNMFCYFGNWNYRLKGKVYIVENRRELGKKIKLQLYGFFNIKMVIFFCYKIKI